jgi:hypothetical protein
MPALRQLVDDDATAYLCVGLRLGGSYVIARLEPNLVALSEEPRSIVVLPDPVSGGTMPGDDKSTLHKHAGTYYLSAGAWYATASSVYGPYTFRGSSSPQVTRANASRSFGLSHQAHGRFFAFRGQWFHVWCEFISENNTTTKDPEAPTYHYRDSWMVYTHYLENGEMEDDWNFLDAHGQTGVGQYDAAWKLVEAEWYMAGTHVAKIQTNGATNNTASTFAVRLNASSELFFPRVANLPARGTLTLQLAQQQQRQRPAGQPMARGEMQAAGDSSADGALAVYKAPQQPAGAGGGGGGGGGVPGPRGTLLARCVLTGKPRVTCPLRVQPEAQGSQVLPGGGSGGGGSTGGGSIDLVFVFEPPSRAVGATEQAGATAVDAVLLDSWSVDH